MGVSSSEEEGCIPPARLADDDVNLTLQTQSNATHNMNDVKGEDQSRSLSLSLSEAVQNLERVRLQEENYGFAQVQVGEDEIHGHFNSLSHPYPSRPHAMNCSFYLRTGTCKFGLFCRFNHPFPKPRQFHGDKKKKSHGLSQDGIRIKGKEKVSLPSSSNDPHSNQGPYHFSKKAYSSHFHQLMKIEEYPERPGQSECTYFMRTGNCDFKSACRYHHPRSRLKSNLISADHSIRKSADSFTQGQQLFQIEEFPERPGQPKCAYYMRTGNCDFKSACKYHHPRSRLKTDLISADHGIRKSADSFTQDQQLLQIKEFPERPGQPECAYYMRTGNCDFKSACKYHHPRSRLKTDLISADHSIRKSADSFTQDRQLLQIEEFPEQSGQSDREYFMRTGECECQTACRCHYARSWLSSLPLPQLGGHSLPSGPQQWQIQIEEFPERPGQPECHYYIKTRNCKHKSACPCHHPANRASTSAACALNEKGLPLSPGSKLCQHYQQLGFCKFGIYCMLDHP